MKILGKNSFLDIQHVGSTSIPSIDAKTIIDIGIAVESFEKSKTLIQPMIDAGYTYKGEFGIPGRHLFFKYDNGLALFHVHMNEITSREWMDQIYFRDFVNLKIHYERNSHLTGPPIQMEKASLYNLFLKLDNLLQLVVQHKSI